MWVVSKCPLGPTAYTCWIENPASWQLIVNRQTGQGGHIYNRRMELGRTDMKQGTHEPY